MLQLLPAFPWQLSLIIDNLPSVEGPLQCVFSAMNKDLTTDATRTAQGVSCTTPRNDMLPDIPQNQRECVCVCVCNNVTMMCMAITISITRNYVLKEVEISGISSVILCFNIGCYNICSSFLILTNPSFSTDHFTAKLSVRKSEGPEFVSTNFTFFDCNTYSSCTECVSSPFPCDWCVDGHRCTHDSAENCRNDVLVNGVNVSSFICIYDACLL